MSEKTVILIDQDGETEWFDTVDEAKKYADNHLDTGTGHDFAIYTLYMRGKSFIQWRLQTDTATNLRETKKTKPPRRGSEWTTREVETLKNSLKEGTSLSQIAKVLGRSYSAVYMKKAKLEESGIIKSGTG